MTPADAIHNMERVIRTARAMRDIGSLSTFMWGYSCGQIDAYAVEAGTKEVFAAQAALQLELEGMREGVTA